jgi:hypothetical protein
MMEQTKLEKDLSERLHCLKIYINNNYDSLTPDVRKHLRNIANGQVQYNKLTRMLEYKPEFIYDSNQR